jgi:hypothetical protein
MGTATPTRRIRRHRKGQHGDRFWPTSETPAILDPHDPVNTEQFKPDFAQRLETLLTEEDIPGLATPPPPEAPPAATEGTETPTPTQHTPPHPEAPPAATKPAKKHHLPASENIRNAFITATIAVACTCVATLTAIITAIFCKALLEVAFA